MKFEAYADLCGMGDYMEAAEADLWPVLNASFIQDAAQACRALCALLMAKCDGKALSIVTLHERSHGPEAWRQLKLEYEGRQGRRVAAMLRGVVKPGPSNF